ncbi:MAG: NAD-dependent epimerase/dehydratase family protein, partial [Bacteroidota bacterium]
MNKDTPILITGATGFVGSYVVRQLWRNGYQQLTGLRRANSSLALLGEAAKHIQWVTADITDYFAVEDALAGQSVVIHCAAKVSFQPGDQKVLFRTNRDGTRHLVDASLHHGVQYFLYLSSVAALGRKPEGFPTDEDTKWEDGPLLSQYARSKFFAELEVWRGQAEGLAVGVLY